MAFSSGTFSRLHDWTTDRDAGIKISASRTDAEFDGIATALTSTMLKDGTQTLTAIIPFTLGLSVPTDKKLQLRDSNIFLNSSASGQADLVANSVIQVTAPTVNIEASTAITLESDAITLGENGDTDIVLTFNANTADGVITWKEDEDYFLLSDDILMNSTEKIQFGDTASFIQQSSDGVLRIDGEATIDLNASTEVNVSAALTVGGRIVTDDATEATSTTDGSLQTDGGLSVVKDAVFGDDLFLKSDSAVLNFGADNDINITHVADTGLTTNGDFSVGDDLKLNSDGAVLGFGADNEITLTHVHNSGLRIEDEDILYFGSDSDLSIQHTETGNLQIIDASSRLLLRAPRIDVQNGDGSESLFIAIDGGAFYAYHNNTQALETTSGGGLTVANGLTLSDGNVTVASGHGISFAATSDASGMASELLDDYEEGTFDLTAHNANLTLEDSSSYGVGRYVKVGRLVTVTCSARVSSVSSTNAVFFTMPFTAQADPTGGQNESSGSGFFSGVNVGDAGLAWYWAGGSNLVTFYKNNDDAGGSQLLNSDLAANDEMYFTATCIANA